MISSTIPAPKHLVYSLRNSLPYYGGLSPFSHRLSSLFASNPHFTRLDCAPRCVYDYSFLAGWYAVPPLFLSPFGSTKELD
ncbi:hypothetical protein PIIN_08382 [Serendipita indica DSM 11827]|uniref:Uncharacterized protein n=1 Tax=Serendipita indica (strain DSM 11827) TaxID=1109443 RepID=G4TSY6_SERID|nr:hypothetical protein PIIN_08382 [Serendipita indica DSM 11827]